MQLMEAAQVIRDSVPMERVLSLYGYTVNSSGFMRCPFHAGDRTASLRVYDHDARSSRRGWYCFGCHAGGSVIDFVMMHESCSFAMAVRAIDNALSLNLLQIESWEDQEEYHLLQSCLNDLEALLLRQIDDEEQMLRVSWRITFDEWLSLARIPAESRTAKQWTRMQNLREELIWQEFREKDLEEARKEVRAWRAGHRVRKRESRENPGRAETPNPPLSPENPRSA